MLDVVVVGGGLGGMLAAAILGREGREVLLVEREAALGGRIRSFDRADGFVLDAGAYLWPDAYVSEAMRRAGAVGFRASEIPRSRVLRLFVEGLSGRRFAFPYPQRRASIKLLESAEVALGVDPEGYEQLSATWARLAALSERETDSMRHVPLEEGLERLRVDERTAAALRRNVMLYGTYDPASASTAECIELGRPPADRPLAAPVVAGANPGGGVAAIVRSLSAALSSAGVEVRTSQAVDEIVLESGRARGVEIAGEKVAARSVVCNVPIWHAAKLFRPSEIPVEIASLAERWSVVGGVIAAAFAFRGMPRLRETGEVDDFPGWTRLLMGPEREFGGGMVWTTLHSPENAPSGIHVLQAMRLSPRREVEDPERVAAVHASFERIVREVYLEVDERLLWCKQWTTPDSSEYLISSAKRPQIAVPDVAGLFLVGETTDVPAVQMDAAALSAMRCAELIGGRDARRIA